MKVDAEYRAKMIASIRNAIKPQSLVTPERQQAVAEALTVILATVMMAQMGIPFSSLKAAGMGMAMLDAMEEWVADEYAASIVDPEAN
jgi:hypothetical protein